MPVNEPKDPRPEKPMSSPSCPQWRTLADRKRSTATREEFVKHRTARYLAVALCAVSACTGSITGDRWPVHRVVGRVTGPAGMPVARAAVSIRSLWGPSCDQTMSVGGPFTASSEGRYRGGFPNGASEFSGCVEVWVVPPSGTGFVEVTRRITGVQLSVARGDSLLVDVQVTGQP